MRSTLPAISVAGRYEPAPLSFGQERLWFLAQLEGVSQAYNVPLGFRLTGAVNEGALRSALDHMVARHEALRTTFLSAEGEPVQRVGPEALGFGLRKHDLRQDPEGEGALRRMAIEEAEGPFDLEAGPLIRGRLIRVADSEHVLLITLHHIVSDGWSIGVLTRELSILYGAFREGRADPLPALAIQYRDFAIWQRRWLSGERLQAQSDYWRGVLSDAPALLDLPTDRPRSAQQDYTGAFVALELDEGLTAKLRALSLRHGASLFMTLLAGWGALLARLSGQDDVVIGAPVANRDRSEVEALIGFFVTSLAVRLDLSGGPTVGGLVERVKVRVLDAQQHQDLPFEQVVEILRSPRSLAHQPVFQAMFAWQNNDESKLDLPDLTVAPFETPYGFAKFDLMLNLGESEGRIVGGLEYATALFDKETVERHACYLRRLLEAMAADDARAVDRLPLLSQAERQQLLYEWNATEADYPQDKCIHELFEAQAASTPEAVAVDYEEQELSYAELNRRANQLAHYLRELGVGPDDRVAICVERSFEMVVGLLAVLKAGGAYVPLDPAYPAERLTFMLEDTVPKAALTHGPSREAMDGAMAGAAEKPLIVDLEADALLWAGRPAGNLDPARVGLTSQHLAYVIYTSGSTGKPKGVMIEHRGLVNYLAWALAAYAPENGTGAPVNTPLAFDATVTSLWGILLSGGCLWLLAEDDEALAHLAAALVAKDRLSEDRFSLVKLTPAHLSVLQHVLTRLDSCGTRAMVIGGEALAAATVIPWQQQAPHIRLINQYGPTEATVASTAWEIAGDICPTRAVPIGRPIANTRIYILDGYGEPVPIGVSGEIHIGGAGVARGYWNRPDLTAERFLASPFVEGDRLYRTGDLGRYLPDGNIEFLGRNDFQVKIRGFRIELGEIEARLLQQPGVREAVVLAREYAPGDKRLVAYYTSSEEITVQQLRAHLAAALPEYMVPAAYVRLEALPLTANGKLDRKTLPAPGDDAYAASVYDAPQGETEEKLAAIWAGTLKLERVGRHDNFFELGGHSLLATRLAGLVANAFGVQIGVAVFFEAPTVREFAVRVSKAEMPPEPSNIVQIQPLGEKTPIIAINNAMMYQKLSSILNWVGRKLSRAGSETSGFRL